MRAVLGQQVSVAGARTLAGRLVAQLGERLDAPDGGLTHLFPEPAIVARAAPEVLAGALAIPAARREALRGLANALTEGGLILDPGANREEVRRKLLSLRGIGAWTADYVAMRALGDPNAFPVTDLGVRRAVEQLGHAGGPASVAALAERWRPWRAYAARHLWASLRDTVGDKTEKKNGAAA